MTSTLRSRLQAADPRLNNPKLDALEAAACPISWDELYGGVTLACIGRITIGRVFALKPDLAITTYDPCLMDKKQTVHKSQAAARDALRIAALDVIYTGILATPDRNA